MRPVTLSVFFPVYNERENLADTVERTIVVLEESPYVRKYELILVDDGSTDGSTALAERFARKHSSVRVVRHLENRGYGAALKTGIAAARMDYVFFTDADLQFDIVELNALLAHLSSYSVVVGYRSPRRDPFLRRVNAWGWNLLNRILFGLHVRDIDCAFKLFDRRLVQSIKLTSHGAMISAETLIRLIRNQVVVKEVPVSHLPRQRGAATGARLSVIARAFREMIDLYRGELSDGAYTRLRGETLRFMAVGVINTALDAAAYVALTRTTTLFADHLLVAKLVSFLAGTVSSLILNRSWTFGVKSRLSSVEVVRFYTMSSLSIAVNVALMDLFLSLGFYDLYALAVTTVFTFVTNFLLSKFWVFNSSLSTKQTQLGTKHYAAS